MIKNEEYKLLENTLNNMFGFSNDFRNISDLTAIEIDLYGIVDRVLKGDVILSKLTHPLVSVFDRELRHKDLFLGSLIAYNIEDLSCDEHSLFKVKFLLEMSKVPYFEGQQKAGNHK